MMRSELESQQHKWMVYSVSESLEMSMLVRVSEFQC